MVKVYVINLDNSLSRWEKVSQDLDHLSASFERVSAIYGKSIDWQAVSDDQFCRSYMGRSIQPGEVGCFMSHVKALQKFIDDAEDYAIILEDDSQVSADFLEVAGQVLARLESTGFDAVNLGPSDYKYASVVAQMDAYKLFCTHRFPMLATGVLWSRKGAQAFLKQFKLVTLPYDNYLRVFLTGNNNSYSVKPAIVTPADFASDIDSEGLTKKRSQLNRSKNYFLIKQKRMFVEKLRASASMLQFKFSKEKK